MKLISTQIDDSVTGYLERLRAIVHADQPNMLKEMTRIATGTYGNRTAYIPRRMSQKYNPNLFMSGQEEERWVIESLGEHSMALFFNYTGMTYQKRFHFSTSGTEGGFMVWKEFAKNPTEPDATKRELERDYSYFQETGKDKKALSKFAKHQGAVRTGLKTATPEIMHEANEYIKQIITKVD